MYAKFHLYGLFYICVYKTVQQHSLPINIDCQTLQDTFTPANLSCMLCQVRIKLIYYFKENGNDSHCSISLRRFDCENKYGFFIAMKTLFLKHELDHIFCRFFVRTLNLFKPVHYSTICRDVLQGCFVLLSIAFTCSSVSPKI